jgi:6-pyruvoyltetrahydropterin/6-carboxytetrahydropterin synthase
MYEITVEDTFDAAHCLPDHEGNCRRLHGHTYRVQARFRFGSIEESGMAIDFRKVKASLRAVLAHLDHQYINDLPAFAGRNPTAENVAKFIFDEISRKHTSLHSVSVWETSTSCATYFPDQPGDQVR